MSKEELRNIIAAGTEKFQQGQEILRYAAYPLPEKKHVQRRSQNLRADAYNEYLDGLTNSR